MYKLFSKGVAVADVRFAFQSVLSHYKQYKCFYFILSQPSHGIFNVLLPESFHFTEILNFMFFFNIILLDF